MDLEQFFLSVREFRSQFRAKAPFTFAGSTKDAYAIMDAQAVELAMKEEEAKAYNELEELFELQVANRLLLSTHPLRVDLDSAQSLMNHLS